METAENSRKNRLINGILGPAEQYGLNHLVFTAVTFCTAVISGLLFCSDIFLRMGFRDYSLSLSGTIVFSLLYYQSRRTDEVKKLFLPYTLVMFIIIFYVWYMLGGITGILQLIALPFCVVFPIILEGKPKYLVLFLLFLSVSAMYIIELNYPGIISYPKDRIRRLLDFYVTTVMIGAGLVLYLSLVMRSHENQAAQIKSLNQSLEKTNRLLTVRNDELQKAITEIKTLQGIVPICASCKKIRDDSGYWHQVEAYVQKHSEAEFSHSLCPDCARKLYPDLHEEEPS